MSKERDLLRTAIKIIEDNMSTTSLSNFISEVDEILAQPEQEPVAWMYDTYEEGYRERYDCLTTIEDYISNTGVTNVRPLYLTPQIRVMNDGR